METQTKASAGACAAILAAAALWGVIGLWNRRLMAAGKPAETPAAVLSGGNAPHPAAVRGTLEDIAAKARAAGVQAPAVIVVGDAAALELSSPFPPPDKMP